MAVRVDWGASLDLTRRVLPNHSPPPSFPLGGAVHHGEALAPVLVAVATTVPDVVTGG